MFEGGAAPRGQPESIQVTARIVRDPNQPFPKMPESRSDPADFAPLDLKQSPLVVDHQRATATAVPAPSIAEPARPATAAPPPVVALGPGPEDGQTDAEKKPRESLLQRRLSKDKRRSQSQDRTSKSAADDSKDDGDDVKRPRRRSSLSVVRDFIKERRNSLRATSTSTDNLLHLSLSPLSVGPQTPSRSPSRPPSVHQNTSFPQRLSISSRRSSIGRDTPPLTGGLSPSLMTEASNSGEDSSSKPGDGTGGDKKSSLSRSRSRSGSESGKNRATRFIRRLSSSLGGGRKNGPPAISPTVAEEDAADVVAASGPSSGGSISAVLQPPSIVAFLGDVNVQFPDNLLWKRRAMCLDSHGFLILSAVPVQAPAPKASRDGGSRGGGAVKRYHLSEFRAPYTPDVEVQELPNSVVLDFVDGSGLQIACEDRAGQLNVLHGELCPECWLWMVGRFELLIDGFTVLQDAHQSHTSFGQ